MGWEHGFHWLFISTHYDVGSMESFLLNFTVSFTGVKRNYRAWYTQMGWNRRVTDFLSSFSFPLIWIVDCTDCTGVDYYYIFSSDVLWTLNISRYTQRICVCVCVLRLTLSMSVLVCATSKLEIRTIPFSHMVFISLHDNDNNNVTKWSSNSCHNKPIVCSFVLKPFSKFSSSRTMKTALSIPRNSYNSTINHVQRWNKTKKLKRNVLKFIWIIMLIIWLDRLLIRSKCFRFIWLQWVCALCHCWWIFHWWILLYNWLAFRW